jgi:hypothetical protein
MSTNLSPSESSSSSTPTKISQTYQCPDIDSVIYFGYIALGVFTPIFIWLVIFKLRGGVLIPILPFNYQMGGIKNIYSSRFLNIGE